MMACAELLAVCLLSADRGPAAPRRQPLPIFHDVSTAGRAPGEPPVPPPGLARAAVSPHGEPWRGLACGCQGEAPSRLAWLRRQTQGTSKRALLLL